MKLFITVIFTVWGFFSPGFSTAQSLTKGDRINEEVKDSIIARYNRTDFKGVYQLADTGFTRSISESQMVTFLTNNFSSGKIIKATFQKDSTDGKHYLLEGQARNLILILGGITSRKKFNDFGFKNSQPEIYAKAPQIKSNNRMASAMDLKIDSIAKEYFRFSQAASLSIGITKNGKRTYYFYGEIKKGSGKLPDQNTGYQIGSVTKTFTSTLLAHAVLENKVKLSDDIRKYLPGNYPNLEYKGFPITLRDLANHGSRLPGLPDNLKDQPGFDQMDPFANYSPDMLFDALTRIKIDTLPGYKFSYSNLGVILLGVILERVNNRSYEELLKKYITVPMNMRSTRTVLTAKDKEGMAVAYGNSGKAVPFWDMGHNVGAGGITSTTADILNYLEFQIKEDDPAIMLTHQLTANSTGLGWGINRRGKYRDLQHSGGLTGSRSHVAVYPELNSACVVLINNDSEERMVNRLFGAIQLVTRAN